MRAYVRIARIDHWDKNVVVLFGAILAAVYQPVALDAATIRTLVAAFVATCLVASGNYVLNELLDAASDRAHPEKGSRPAAQGLIDARVATIEWLLCVVAGLMLGRSVNATFNLYLTALAVMGLAYNVPPVRTKDWPYLDVLSESLNTPIRLCLGWAAVAPALQPPVALLVSAWLGFAFLMAVKRYAELRHLGDPVRAAAYRRSFAYYTPERLMVSLFVYATTGSVFAGIFIAQIRLELVLCLPLAAGFFGYYLYEGLLPDSPVRAPERLYRRPGFGAYAVLCIVVFAMLLFASIPSVHGMLAVPGR